MNKETAGKLVEMLLDDTSSQELSDLPKIEGYTLIQEIGRGGGGVVYEGVADATGRAVAIKILRSRKSGSAMQALLEMDRLTEVRSPVVPHVFEHGWVDGAVFIVTEFIHGVSPIAYAEDLETKGRVELLAKIADAVGVLNERGIIHRDLKPTNILVTTEGNPVILDLGISVADKLDAGEMVGGDGRPIGTLAYMAPEQARGENDGVSTRWDVYALGAVGYELLTGSTPHELPESVTMGVKQVGRQQARSPRELNPKLPRPLAHVLEKACAWEAEDRYESAQLLRDDLKRWLNREPVVAGPQTGWTRALRLAGKHPVASVGGICAMIFVISILSTWALVWWQNVQPYQFQRMGSDWLNSTSLVSRSGNIIHTWETRDDEGIGFAGAILEGANHKYAVIGLAGVDIHSGVYGLIGYTLGEYQEPAWVATQEVPAELGYAIRNGPSPHRFQFRKLYIEDVFPELPGDELISIHRHHPYSACAIQVHSIDGELLCEYYHDGWASTLYWNSVHGQIVVAGKVSDGTWLERGASEMWPAKYPVVVYAIKPNIGDFGIAISHPESGMVGALEPLWYKCILPGSAYHMINDDIKEDFIRVYLGAPDSFQNRQAGNVKLELGGENAQLESVRMIIDHNGTLVSVTSTDDWSRTHGVDPSVYYLGDLPERTEPRKIHP